MFSGGRQPKQVYALQKIFIGTWQLKTIFNYLCKAPGVFFHRSIKFSTRFGNLKLFLSSLRLSV
jgi:hypothetical protein